MNQGDTFDAPYDLADRIMAQHLGTCDHIDIWGETGENGIACKSPAIKQCEGCGESMCKAHLVDNLCWECAVKI